MYLRHKTKDYYDCKNQQQTVFRRQQLHKRKANKVVFFSDIFFSVCDMTRFNVIIYTSIADTTKKKKIKNKLAALNHPEKKLKR